MTESFTRQTANLTVRQLTEAWGGRLPTWEEFKQASRSGRVAVDKTVALQAIQLNGMPKFGVILFGYVTMWSALLAIPAAIVAWAAFGWSGYWILGAVAASMFLFSVSRNGHCEVTRMGAENHQHLYEQLVSHGAFFFRPTGGL